MSSRHFKIPSLTSIRIQIQEEGGTLSLIIASNELFNCRCGLWQFGVDLPYDCVSEECRLRCEFLLRVPEKYGIHELYDVPIDEIRRKIETSEEKERMHNCIQIHRHFSFNNSDDLKSRIASLDQTDGVFLVNALSMIMSSSSTEATRFIKQIIDVRLPFPNKIYSPHLQICFCDESYREQFYKVGSEAIAQLMEKRPNCLEVLISVLDRQMSHMDNVCLAI